MTFTDDFLPVPVAETLSATYLVPSSAPPATTPAQAVAALGDRLSAPVRELAGQLLDSGLATVTTRPIGDFPRLPDDLLSAFGATTGQLDRVTAASHLVVVQATYRPGWPPAHEWTARAVAAGLAIAVGGDVVDIAGLRFLDPAAALASLPDREGRIRLVDWLVVPFSPAEGGLWFTTKGLRRFGLLELQARDVPPRLARPWGAVLTGVARRLLGTWSAALAVPESPVFVRLPRLVGVTAADIAAAHGAPSTSDSPAGWLRIELDPATDPAAESFLTLLPPDGHTGPAGDHYAEVCNTITGLPAG